MFNFNSRLSSRRHTKIAASMAAMTLMTVGLVTTATPAHAAAKCVTATEWTLYGDVNTKTLRGYSVKLQSGRTSAAARAQSNVPPGGIISIDRSINQFTPTAAEKSAGHGWRTTTQVANNGGYDYCEGKNTASSTVFMSTKSVEGSYNAVRQCLRVSGTIECSSQWYVDFDD
ncbi:hypothetical protein [Streptosporangium sp. OZ121]|uniref:hypothetical protein n=1 Tax=Streptosporangium sp. OZ121 TaxID=3444183 RepID=UPI003F7946E2